MEAVPRILSIPVSDAAPVDTAVNCQFNLTYQLRRTSAADPRRSCAGFGTLDNCRYTLGAGLLSKPRQNRGTEFGVVQHTPLTVTESPRHARLGVIASNISQGGAVDCNGHR